jgi:hypothetical protein
MFLVGSNWLVVGLTEFMKRKLATGGVFKLLWFGYIVTHCTKLTYTYKGRQRNGGDCLHEWLQNTWSCFFTHSLQITY